MATATLILTDGEEPGTFRLDTAYQDGFQVDSHAHQHALLLVKHMSELAERRGDTQVTQATGTTPEAAAEMARVMDDAGIPAVPLEMRPAGEFDDQAVAEGRPN